VTKSPDFLRERGEGDGKRVIAGGKMRDEFL